MTHGQIRLKSLQPNSRCLLHWWSHIVTKLTRLRFKIVQIESSEGNNNKENVVLGDSVVDSERNDGTHPTCFIFV